MFTAVGELVSRVSVKRKEANEPNPCPRPVSPEVGPDAVSIYPRSGSDFAHIVWPRVGRVSQSDLGRRWENPDAVLRIWISPRFPEWQDQRTEARQNPFAGGSVCPYRV